MGRRAYRDALWGTLAQVRDKRAARMVIIRGPAGVGKSGLMRWFIERVGELANADVAGGVVTRLLSNDTLAVYIDAVAPPSGEPAVVLLTGARGRTLRCALCDAPGVWANASVRVVRDDAADTVRVGGLTPRRFYLFDVVDATPAATAAERAGALLGACSTDLDCSLNGECLGGACVCDGGWGGDACEQLRFGPASRAGERDPRASPRACFSSASASSFDSHV